MESLTRLSKERLAGVEPLLINIIEQAILNSPYRFQIAWMGGYRTEADQKVLFDKGSSKCDGIKKLSKHQSGEAFDIICYDEQDKITWDVDVFTEVAHWILWVAETVFSTKLEWGGDWKNFVDRPHFQLNK